MEREILDLELIDEMDAILEAQEVSLKEKIEAGIVKTLMSLKCSARSG